MELFISHQKQMLRRFGKEMKVECKYKNRGNQYKISKGNTRFLITMTIPIGLFNSGPNLTLLSQEDYKYNKKQLKLNRKVV